MEIGIRLAQGIKEFKQGINNSNQKCQRKETTLLVLKDQNSASNAQRNPWRMKGFRPHQEYVKRPQTN
eukprot:3142062-Prorocentrum_lima.AAC.1